MKLILGTASFGPVAYGEGVVEPPTSDEIARILDVAHKGGIRTLESAEAYKVDLDILSDPRFQLIYKVTHPYDLNTILVDFERDYLTGLLYHHSYESRAQMPIDDSRIQYRGASVYSHGQLSGQEDMVEVPLNIEDTTFKNLTSPCKLVRSVFGRGKLLKQYSVKECLDFVKANPTVHGVIVGVNAAREMEEILKAWS